MNVSGWYDQHYKKLLIIPVTLLLLAVGYLFFFYSQHGDVINRDVSLTGGSTITIKTTIPVSDFKIAIAKEITDFDVKATSDNSGQETNVVIIVPEEQTETLKLLLEKFLGYLLDNTNSSLETTSASLSSDFYKQLIIAVILAFFWMSAVVFLIFAKGFKVKLWTVMLNILFGFFLGNFFYSLPTIISAIIFLAFITSLIYLYIKNSVPAFAVMSCAFADIIMTLAIVDFMGMTLSSAGIVAFLMLIGYSVDTDILLTSRLTKRKSTINSAIFGAFKTGITMTLMAIVALGAALIVVYPFGSVLNQIFIILLIGLFLDILNTWVTNASIIKWYMEHKNETNH